MSIADTFQQFKRIFGICPCCGEPFRLSDCTIYTRTGPPPSPFDALDGLRQKVDRAAESLDNAEDRLKDKARELGRRAAEKRIRAFTPFFSRSRIVPQDVRVIFHPVDYLVFKGLSGQQCSSVELVDRRPETTSRERLQRSIAEALKSGNLEWVTLRIGDDGAVAVQR